MKNIEHFLLPEQTNKLYQNEAISSISLTKKVADKINEIVDSLNELSNNDLVWKHEQEGTIRKAIIYIKDNLMNTLHDLIEMLEGNGYFDETVKKYVTELESRVDNLISNNSVDGEIVDGRYDSVATWKTIGACIRNISSLVTMTANNSFYKYEKVDTPIINGWLDRFGEYHSNTESGDTHKCVKFNVKSGEKYLLYSEYGWNMSDAVALDSNNNVVCVYHTADERVVNDYRDVIVIPDTATYLVVNTMSPSRKPLTVSKIIECDNKSIINYVNNCTLSMKGDTPILSDDLIDINNTKMGYAIRGCEEFLVESGNTSFITGYCDVVAGNYYKIICGANFECNPYVFVNDDNVPIDYSPIAPANEYKSYEFMVFAPYGSTKLIVGNFNGVKPQVYQIKGFTRNEKQWNHLKWCCIGDSLTELNERTDKHYFDYISEKTGINIINMGVGGTGYKRGYEDNNAFYQRVSNIPECDVITIFGSGNDNTYFNNIGEPTDTDTSTLCGCINKTIDNIYAKYPTVQLAIVSPTPWINHQPNNETGFIGYSEALEEICKLRGIPYLDLFHCSGFRPNEESYRNLVFSKDNGNGVHPNELGHKIISGHFYNLLNSLISTY